MTADAIAHIEQLHDRYSDAWRRHDLDDIMSMHTPDTVFHQHIGVEEARGWEAVRQSIADVFTQWPDLEASTRRRYTCEGLWVWEGNLKGTLAERLTIGGAAIEPNGKPVEFHCVDVVPVEGGLVKRKDTYLDLAAILRHFQAMSPDSVAAAP